MANADYDKGYRAALDEALAICRSCMKLTVNESERCGISAVQTRLQVRRPPGAPRRWRHKKRDSYYSEVCRGALQIASGHVFTEGDMLVAYRAEADGSVYFRLVPEFEDGCFEELVVKGRQP